MYGVLKVIQQLGDLSVVHNSGIFILGNMDLDDALGDLLGTDGGSPEYVHKNHTNLHKQTH